MAAPLLINYTKRYSLVSRTFACNLTFCDKTETTTTVAAGLLSLQLSCGTDNDGTYCWAGSFSVPSAAFIHFDRGVYSPSRALCSFDLILRWFYQKIGLDHSWSLMMALGTIDWGDVLPTMKPNRGAAWPLHFEVQGIDCAIVTTTTTPRQCNNSVTCRLTSTITRVTLLHLATNRLNRDSYCRRHRPTTPLHIHQSATMINCSFTLYSLPSQIFACLSVILHGFSCCCYHCWRRQSSVSNQPSATATTVGEHHYPMRHYPIRVLQPPAQNQPKASYQSNWKTVRWRANKLGFVRDVCGGSAKISLSSGQENFGV